MAAMADQAMKRRRGRPRSTDAKTGAERQQLYAKARARDMAEVAYPEGCSGGQGDPEGVHHRLPRHPSGARLRRGLARLLADDPVAMAFFDGLISSGDDNRWR
jgi:hypothetical protein